MTTHDESCNRFRALHATGCFVMPNPWDVGSARAMQSIGFSALATTSAGFAFSRGLPDSPDALPVDSVLDNIAEIVAAVDVPVNADFQAGYAADHGRLAENVQRCIATGVAGLSIEDLAPGANGALFERDEAVARVKAARSAIDRSGVDVLLTARTECFLTGHPSPLDEAMARLPAFAAAGADVLFAPGVSDIEDMQTLVNAVSPLPLNVLMGSAAGLTVNDLEAVGVRRISVGSGLARTAWSATLRASRILAADGSFEGMADATSFAELNDLFEQ